VLRRNDAGSRVDHGTRGDPGRTRRDRERCLRQRAEPGGGGTGGGGTCFFQNAEPSQYLSVQLFTNQAGMATWLGLETSGTHVDGLGDDAFWLGTTGMMFVRKGDRAFLLLNPAWTFTPETDTAHRDSMTTLARAALLNL
jgi:hypothetical protein